MQQDKYRQLYVDFELTNYIFNAERILRNISGDRISIIYQLINLVGYKYLSENAKNKNEDIGYKLNEDLYYENLLINKGNAINILKEGIVQITQNNENIQASDIFYNLFDLVDFETFSDNETWLLFVEAVEILSSQTIASLGEIIIFLTKYISSINGKKSASLKPTEDIVKLMTTSQKDVENIYDPYADEATLLAEIGNIINVENYYGQHPNIENCILSKMTLLTNNVNYKNIFIKCNDIAEPINWNVKFDLCVSIPPFGIRIKLKGDTRFEPYVPRDEFAFILDMLYHLKDDGTIKIIVPNGLLFNTHDQKIRRYLVDNGYISSIIGLPGGLFDMTSIPTTLLIINKKGTDKEIYYLNATNAKTERKINKRPFSIVDIDNYVELLSNNKEKELISKKATIDDIQKNDYILTINRYVDLEKLKVVNIEKTISNINKIKIELKDIEKRLNKRIDDLF